MGDECFEELCTLVSAECLRSFKNGLVAGKSRADRPHRSSTNVRGSVLANGKLRPAERDLVAFEDEE